MKIQYLGIDALNECDNFENLKVYDVIGIAKNGDLLVINEHGKEDQICSVIGVECGAPWAIVEL